MLFGCKARRTTLKQSVTNRENDFFGVFDHDKTTGLKVKWQPPLRKVLAI